MLRAMETTAADIERFGFPVDGDALALREAAARFARERLAPGAAARDRERRFPVELLGEIGELGLFGVKVPALHGGPGGTHEAYALVMEAIARACASTAVILASTNLVSGILAARASTEQQRRFLRPLAAGSVGPAAFCLTEPDAGSDASALRTVARRQAGGYVIDGSKMWITSGAYAGVYLVFAKTDPATGSRGISAFVVERGTPGLHIGKDEPKMGLRSSGTVALSFEGCRVPEEQRIGDEGDGYPMALEALGGGRVGIAAQALGIAEAAFAEGLRYARGRKVFGRTVADFQASQFALADSRMDLDAAWLLTLRAARLLDGGARAPMETSLAKLAASEACGRVVDRMLQLHGGYGYSEEQPIERLYRDARITRIYEGTSEIQRLVIARELLRA
jgi:alkylation response protein AidB-like acyl-CoA dehydrogenase